MAQQNPVPSPQEDERAIAALFEAADRALMANDLAALANTFADDYVQYDPAGRPHTKQQIFASLQTGAVRYPSITSTGRTIRRFGDMAAVHGSETDEVDRAGQRTTEKYLYCDVLQKRHGRWQIVSSLLAKPADL
jgi:uncharacterized protein (TIGR02246 family)